MPKVGIDFGTTNSLIVAYDKSSNKFLYFNYNGSVPVPTASTVWYYDQTIIVGDEAKEKLYTYDGAEGHHFERSIKSKLDSEYKANVFGESKTPAEVASEILSHLKERALVEYKAEKAGVDLKQAVFTVPINFSGKARMALREAANKAGIEVTTFIHEPFAAIVGYYFTRTEGVDLLDELEALNGYYVLTFDWGGGTLDITVTKIDNGKMVELGTSELTGLAGDKFDELIATWAWNKYAEKVAQKYSSAYLEQVRKNKWGRLLAIAEHCKIELSTEEEATFLLETVIPQEDIGIDEIVTREIFSDLITDIVDKACNKIDEAIRQADINEVSISKVLLTGGTCNIPAIQNKLKEKFGHRTEIVKNADLVIAQGAAVVAEYGWLPFLTKDIQVELSDGSYWPIFERNMPISADNKEALRSEQFTCVDQRNGYAKIIISDGIDQQKDSTLAILNVPILGDKRFGDDILLQASIDKNIILHISANSKMIHGYGRGEAYSERKTKEVYRLCFGLDISR